MCPHWWIIRKQSTFFEDNKIQRRKSFLQNIVFLSYRRSTAPPLITTLFKIFFWKNIFLEKHFFQIIFFVFIINRVYPYWWIIPNQPILFMENKFLWKKMVSPKFKGSFLTSVLSTPSDNNVLHRKFHKKCFFFIKTFLPSYKFFLTFICHPIDFFYQAIQNYFFMIFFPWRKKFTLRKNFQILTLVLCTPNDNNVFHTMLSEKHLPKKIFFKNLFYFHRQSCVFHSQW